MSSAKPYANPEMPAEDRDFYRWYGPWQPLTPRGMVRVMRGANIRWWIVGGWAVDAFTGMPREHEDIDVSFFRADLPACSSTSRRVIASGRISPARCGPFAKPKTCSTAHASSGCVATDTARGSSTWR